jgi:hypothetical protein
MGQRLSGLFELQRRLQFALRQTLERMQKRLAVSQANWEQLQPPSLSQPPVCSKDLTEKRPPN